MISNLIKNYNRKEVKEEVNVGTYLEFKSSTPMTITPNYTNTGVTLQYSLNAKIISLYMRLERNTQIWVFRILKPNHEIFRNTNK